MKQGTQNKYTGITLRDGMGREVGGGAPDVHPWLIHINVWQKNHHNIVKELASN